MGRLGKTATACVVASGMPADATTEKVYRAPMRSRHSDVADGAAVERALSQGLCGFGGALDPAPSDLSDALAKAHTQHDERLARRIGRFAAAPEGSWVWTRDVDGLYWLGQLGGMWRYDASEAASLVDLCHVRPCRWLSDPIADARVPGGVLATFARGGKNWQQMHATGVAESSELLFQMAAWERLALLPPRPTLAQTLVHDPTARCLRS